MIPLPKTSLQQSPNTRGKERLKQRKKIRYAKSAYVYKEFVNWKMLLLTFTLTILFVLFYFYLLWVRGESTYTIFYIGIVVFFFTWNKMYQVLYDLKTVFFYNNQHTPSEELTFCKNYPVVTFIVPSYHEPFNVAKMTLDSIVKAPYRGKREIIVVDNSCNVLSEDFTKLKDYIKEFKTIHSTRDISAKFIHNRKTDTLKPGNLDLAEQFIEEGEFVVILDVDSTLPEKEGLLEKAVAEFLLDNKLGFLQFHMKATNHHFNDLTQSIAASQDLHRLRLTSRSNGGYKIFEGHNGMWRKNVLEKVGPWTNYYKDNIMVTEDILKSALMYAQGYYGKTLDIATGEWVPNSLNALEGMWMRWTYGTSQVMFKHYKEIYGETISLVKKFDITYHALGHLFQGFILPTAILLQIFMPGLITNIFVIMTYLLPQLVSATTIYFFSVRKLKIPIIEKIKCLYGAFFLVDTFIMSVQLKSSLNFLVGVPQGWKVTSKCIDNTSVWKHQLLNKPFHLAIICIAFIGCGASWLIHYDMYPSEFIHLVLLGFMSTNLLLCMLVFGRMGRKECNDVASATIDGTTIRSELVDVKAIRPKQLCKPAVQI